MKDDLGAYHAYQGPPPPEIEQRKYRMSKEAESLAQRGDYRAAAAKKREIARICRSQGKERDAHLLEVSAYELERKS